MWVRVRMRVCVCVSERQRDGDRENKKDMPACFSLIPTLDFQGQNPRDCFLGVLLSSYKICSLLSSLVSS